MDKIMLEFETTYPKIRIYFNSRAAFPWTWSIDNGDQDTELLAKNVITQGVGKFEYNGQAPNPTHPVAWLEFADARVHQIEDNPDDLFIENSRD